MNRIFLPKDIASYQIREEHNPHGYGLVIEIAGVESVPAVLQRLAEMGHDMTYALEVLQQAVEEQRKRKVIDAAIKDLKENA